MKRMREDNTVSVIQRAVKHFEIPVTKSTVKEALKSHSYYPSFKSICDTLSDWKVENYPLKYKPEEMKELTAPYIVHFNGGGGQLAFVSKIRYEKVTYYDSYKSKHEVDFPKFIERSSGAVIILNPDEKSGEKDYKRKWQDEVLSSAVLPVSVFSVLLFIVLAVINLIVTGSMLVDTPKVLLLLTKTAGITLPVLLVLHEFEVRPSLTEKLCHLNKSTNCNIVLNDKASKVFGWYGWADVGFVYFTGCLLFLFKGTGSGNYSLLAILSAFSLPYPVFSIYYQGFVLKKWCPLCLGVQLILIIEFVLLLPQFSDLNFSLISISDLTQTFLITFIIYALIIMYLREKMSNEMHYYKYLRFKKNANVLGALLFNQKHYEIPVTESSLVFGKRDSSIMITAFLSLQCSHCARAFEKIKYILETDASVSINIILMTSDSKIINTLYHLNRAKMYNDALSFLDQWYNMDSYSRNKVSESLCIPEVDDISDEIGNYNALLYKSCNVIGTPSFFVNGYLLPGNYEIDDTKNFTEVFSKKEEIVIKNNQS